MLTAIWDYLDGQCSDPDAATLITHIPACPPCARRMEIEERFLASLGEIREWSRAPAGLHGIVRRVIGAERQVPRGR